MSEVLDAAEARDGDSDSLKAISRYAARYVMDHRRDFLDDG